MIDSRSDVTNRQTLGLIWHMDRFYLVLKVLRSLWINCQYFTVGRFHIKIQITSLLACLLFSPWLSWNIRVCGNTGAAFPRGHWLFRDEGFRIWAPQLFTGLYSISSPFVFLLVSVDFLIGLCPRPVLLKF